MGHAPFQIYAMLTSFPSLGERVHPDTFRFCGHPAGQLGLGVVPKPGRLVGLD